MFRRPVDLPLPPLEMRKLVGPTDPSAFDNPTGRPVFADIPPEAFSTVLDFGCGCGRVARQLIQQKDPPRSYVGIDLHPGMIRWCRDNLAPRAPGFQFEHHDVEYEAFNPGAGKPRVLPFPAADSSCTLVIAHSVFTHLFEDQTEHYLREVARVLAPGGVMRSTWFVFEKSSFPMMQDFQNTLFINPVDPVNAVIYDRTWLVETAKAAGLTVSSVTAPGARGFHWVVQMGRRAADSVDAVFPVDDAPVGSFAPPADVVDPSAIGYSR